MQKKYFSLSIISSKLYFFLAVALLCLSFRAECAVFPMPAAGNDIVGNVFTTKVKSKDSITTIRLRYEISYHELVEANPSVNFFKLKVGQPIVIPTRYILPEYRRGIVINMAELRLYYFTKDGRFVYTYPVGLGRLYWRTPTVITKIVAKRYKPTWHVPASIKRYMLKKHNKLLPDVILPGEDNPLGDYALYLGKKSYLIHGTNMPESVGMFVSSGCIRLANDAVKKLFLEAAIGTEVYIVHHQSKAGFENNILYLETQAPVKLDEKQKVSPLSYKDAIAAVEKATRNRQANIDWKLVKAVEQQQTGIPTKIGEQK